MSFFSSASSSSSSCGLGPQTPQSPPPRNYSYPISSTPRSHAHTHSRNEPSSSSISSTTTLDTPPDSLRSYAKALQASMAKGMQVAMADLTDKAREMERAFDREFGYEDENPIDRHVRLFLTPRRSSVASGKLGKVGGLEVGVLESEVEMEMEMLGDSPEVGRNSIDHPEGSFRPGLLNFTKTTSDRPMIPAFQRTISEELGLFGALKTGGDTPGSEYSVQSESSFEAIKSEDYISLYGGSDRSSCTSTITAASSSSTITMSRGGAALGSTPKRPSLLRPKGGSKRRVHPYESVGGDGEEDWMTGRTISETMVAQAGLRSQRGRAGRGARV